MDPHEREMVLHFAKQSEKHDRNFEVEKNHQIIDGMADLYQLMDVGLSYNLAVHGAKDFQRGKTLWHVIDEAKRSTEVSKQESANFLRNLRKTMTKDAGK